MKSRANKALSVTFCGMMAALGAALMLLGGVLAVFTYAAPLLASVCLIPVLREFGKKSAWLCYTATAVICVLLCPDKELAFFYALFGYYPVIRGAFVRIRSKPLRLLLKLLYFAAAEAALYAFLCFVLRLDAVLSELQSTAAFLNVLFFLGLLAALLVYDAALGVAFTLYESRIRPKLRFLDK